MDTPLEIPKLPEDIIIEILSRLPVRSLLRFKCVSKSWCCMISSKEFIKTHFEKNTSFANHRIVTIIRKPVWRRQHYSLPSLSSERITYEFPFDCTLHKSNTLVFVGSCNGLICILIDKKYFILWNPCTGESKKLPDFIAGMKHIDDGVISKYGFGFDESSGDYKVYAVFSVVRFDSIRWAIGQVYSLRGDSWETNEFLEYDSPLAAQVKFVKRKLHSPLAGEGKFAGGMLHWNRNLEWNSIWNIVSFDLKSEVWDIMKQPSNVEGGFQPRLSVLDGCLCMQCYYNKKRLDVWVCNEYGVEDSWVKRLTISYVSHPLDYSVSTPMFTFPNGNVLFVNKLGYRWGFLIYNPKENELWYPKVVGYDDEFFEAALYVESLVSLVTDRKQKRQA